MKLVKVLDPAATALIADLRGQLILRELVMAEYSVSELSRRLRLPTVTVWKKVQKFISAGLAEVSGVRRSGNLEVKMYRASAANYVPGNVLDFRPKDPHLSDALGAYSEIQKMALAMQTRSFEVPAGADPVDYFHYAGMRAFVDLHRTAAFGEKLAELGEKLAAYERGRK